MVVDKIFYFKLVNSSTDKYFKQKQIQKHYLHYYAKNKFYLATKLFLTFRINFHYT